MTPDPQRGSHRARRRAPEPGLPRARRVLLLVGIFGTCLFYGDGVITPAISVLSAVEGLEVISPAFKKYVIPLTLVILFGLFAVPRFCTANSPNRMMSVSGITYFLKAGEITSRPSTADSTEIAGVMTPSP